MTTSSKFDEFQHQGKLDVAIFGLVGGPGSGKGTQCSLLTQSFSELAHLSIGDTMRGEMNTPGSPYAEIIKENMSTGRVGPPELTVGVLRRRMESIMGDGSVRAFILDG